jgi:signal transduction histidine kinase/CheY-like chemotaxis protein
MAPTHVINPDKAAKANKDVSDLPGIVECTAMIPLAAGFTIAGVILLFVWILDRNATAIYVDEVRADTVRDLAAVRAAAEIAINKRVHLTLGLKANVSVNPDITSEEFANLAALLMHEANGIRSVTSIRDNVIDNVYPREGNEDAIGLELLRHPDQRAAAEYAIQTGRPWLGGPVKLVQGGEAFINRAPVYITVPGEQPGAGRYWGMVSIVIDKQTIVDELMGNVPPTLSVAVRGRTDRGEPGDIFWGDRSIESLDPLSTEISLPTGSWQLYGVPRNGWPTRSLQATRLRTLGLSLAVLAGAMTFMVVQSFQRYREYAQRLERAHFALQRSSVEMAAAQQAAEDASRAKSDFLANMSHEIRTPLSTVIGLTDLVLDTSLTAEQRDYLKMVHESGESLLAVINDILDFSKIEAGKLDLITTAFDIRSAVSDMIRPLSIRARSKGVVMTCDFDPDVPAVLEGDPYRLRQILVNLVGNALKFTEAGEISVDVAVAKNTATTTDLYFSIRDTGIGIPKDQLVHIFGAFEQVDAGASRRFGGTGLGLTICARLVSLMNGRIWAHSELGKGSIFHFTIQMTNALTASPTQVSAVDELQWSRNGSALLSAADEATPIRPLKILLAEDDPFNQRLGVALLEKQGHTVSLAASGRQVLDAWNSGTFDLIIMDVQMPEMDGLEATRRIREAEQPRGTHIPIVAMTAHALAGDRQMCLDAGMDAYTTKPLRITALNRELFRFFADSSGVPTSHGSHPGTDIRIDWTHALDACDGDQTLLLNLLQVFVRELPELMNSLEFAITANDFKAAREIVHNLHGSLQMFGLTRTLVLTEQIQRHARNGDLRGAIRPFAELRLQAQTLIADANTVIDSKTVV